MTSMTSCIVGKKIEVMGPGPQYYFPLLFWLFVCELTFIFVSKISQVLLYLETWNLVHMTSKTICIVENKIGPWDQVP